jgi:prepilin-type N-terminal cleavage/methylation domain-containing protein
MPIRLRQFRANYLYYARGFSLLEIAVVLLIISILVTAVGIPLATQIDQQRTLETTKQLESIKEALYGYALANGRLPCPATDGTIYGTASSNGLEAFAVGGTIFNGNCSVFVGFIPSATLGLSPIDAGGFSVDAWGSTQNRIRYAVRGLTITAASPAACLTGVVNPLTRSSGIQTASMACLADTSATVNLLSVVSTTVTNAAAGCTPATLTSKAPFVIFSMGKNAATGGTGSDEAQNAMAPANTTFVSHTPTQTGNCAGEFDDIVTWGSLNTLFARMVQAGKLP